MNEQDIYGALKYNHENFGFVPRAISVSTSDFHNFGVLRLAGRLSVDYIVEVKETKHNVFSYPVGWPEALTLNQVFC